MNLAINSLFPLASVSQTVQLKQNQGMKLGFGSVLQSAVGADSGSSLDTESLRLSNEEVSTLKDLLDILKLNSLSDLEEESVADDPLVNNQGDVRTLLFQLLKRLSGNNEETLTEFFTTIEEINLEQEPEDLRLDSQSLLSANVMELYTILIQVASLSEEEWKQLPLEGTANLLKLVKFHDLLSENKDMTQDEATIHKQMKNLLEGISGKLEKWLPNQQQKTNTNLDFSLILEKGQNKTLETNAFSQLTGSDKLGKDGTNSTGLTLKTADSSNYQGSGMSFLMTKLEQFVLTAAKGGQTVSQEEFVKQFESILSKANFTGANGVNKLLIKLNPEHLGSLRIELIQKDGMMTAKILATSAQAKDMLEKQIHGLKHAFNGQNIQIEKIEVSQAYNTFNSEKFSQKDADEQNRQQENKRESNDETESEFTGSFAEALLNLEV
ncbi:flagellar hook-length control protein FliK [Peribacillus butanolivorans]|uniref:flagellar hook-length control protein FliK n=1 Tax=Peribacillus butanolivorans TaxID=421767 RepID=UPI0006A74BE9|nr:flagellar hook-length control protein FliK [Peribacillus butanolivorans]